jgi:hypothetical protein
MAGRESKWAACSIGPASQFIGAAAHVPTVPTVPIVPSPPAAVGPGRRKTRLQPRLAPLLDVGLRHHLGRRVAAGMRGVGRHLAGLDLGVFGGQAVAALAAWGSGWLHSAPLALWWGAALVVGAGLYSIWHERRSARPG